MRCTKSDDGDYKSLIKNRVLNRHRTLPANSVLVPGVDKQCLKPSKSKVNQICVGCLSLVAFRVFLLFVLMGFFFGLSLLVLTFSHTILLILVHVHVFIKVISMLLLFKEKTNAK